MLKSGSSAITLMTPVCQILKDMTGLPFFRTSIHTDIY